jgi:hypothetical protein
MAFGGGGRAYNTDALVDESQIPIVVLGNSISE